MDGFSSEIAHFWPGGGYTKQSVAKCWALETAVLVGQDKGLPDELPDNVYHDYFAPDFRLNMSRKRIMEDENNKAEVERLKVEVLENLRHLQAAPGDSLLPSSAIHAILQCCAGTCAAFYIATSLLDLFSSGLTSRDCRFVSSQLPFQISLFMTQRCPNSAGSSPKHLDIRQFLLG